MSSSFLPPAPDGDAPPPGAEPGPVYRNLAAFAAAIDPKAGEPASAKPSLTNGGALMGIDPGSKRVGLAVSDATRLIASPLTTLKRDKFAPLAKELLAHFHARRCTGFVVGLPLTLGGQSGPAAQASLSFARNLLSHAERPIPILMWDERLSTAAVTRAMIADDATRAARARHVDQLAAAYMLQGALDALRELAITASS